MQVLWIRIQLPTPKQRDNGLLLGSINMRLASIDIGSNAVRCMISEVLEEYPVPTKLKLLRLPIRLGFDTFLQGRISKTRAENLIRTMKMFRLLMDIYEVEHYRACATSAFRDASNREALAQVIYDETGIIIDIVNGREEAQIIFAARTYEQLDPNGNYLFIDVGGGSTDVTLFCKGHQRESHTFNIGTIRLLNKQVSKAAWEEMQSWIETHIQPVSRPVAVGSGGNINTIFQLSRKKKGSALSADFLNKFCEEINALSVEERMLRYAMKPDRADVVGHACRIFTSIMHWGHMKKILVPQVGLVDGIAQQLADKYLHKHHSSL